MSLQDAIRELKRLKHLKWSGDTCRLYEAKITDDLGIQLLECEGGYTTVSIIRTLGSSILNKIEMNEAEFQELIKAYNQLKNEHSI